MATRRFLIAAFLALAGACSSSNVKHGDGYTCGSDSDCKSGHCIQDECTGCLVGTDCQGAGELCIPAPDGGPYGTCSDGCLETACPTGFGCDPSTKLCYAVGPPALPVCGQSDPSGGFDAGFGPGPDVSGHPPCAACAGCPRGSECVCGASGVIGGVRCTNAAAALACFATGVVGDCQVFAGDCATNTQCEMTPATPHCSASGTCVACLRDADCPQDAGAVEGCSQNQCGFCCRHNADCGPSSFCDKGFCYAACQSDQSCGDLDAGTAFCCANACKATCGDAGTDAG